MASLADCPIHYKALIFDCDGVMVDSEPLHCQTWREVLLSHGVDMSVESIMRFSGQDAAQTMFVLMEKEGLLGCDDPQDWIIEKRNLFWKYLDESLCEIPGIGSFFAAMASRIPLAMATGAPRSSYSRVLRRMGWEDVFAVAVGADDIVRSKPDPEIYHLALERLGLASEQCLVFEDSLPGIKAARAAGIDVVGVASTHPAEMLRAAGATSVIRDFSDEALLCTILSPPSSLSLESSERTLGEKPK